MRRVWIDGWQMQCCGDPLEIGSNVAWTIAEVDTDFLGVVLGEEPPPRRYPDAMAVMPVLTAEELAPPSWRPVLDTSS